MYLGETGGETDSWIPSSDSRDYLFQLFLFTLFKKSTVRAHSQIMILVMAIYFTSLLDLQYTSRDKLCFHPKHIENHVWRQGPKYSGMITSIMGLVALIERHTHIKGIMLLCMHWRYHGNQVRSCSLKYQLWTLENWNLELCLWSDFRFWPSPFGGLDCMCWNQCRFGHCLCTYFF